MDIPSSLEMNAIYFPFEVSFGAKFSLRSFLTSLQMHTHLALIAAINSFLSIFRPRFIPQLYPRNCNNKKKTLKDDSRHNYVIAHALAQPKV